MRAIRPATAIAACLALAAAPALTGGCSFIFVRRPHKEAPGRYAPTGCTTSRGVPWLDFGLSAAQGYATFRVLGQTDGQYAGTGVSRDERVWMLAGTTMLYAVSAMYGFSTVGTCREVSAQSVIPYASPPSRQTRAERRSDEAAEEAAVQARLRENAKAETEKAAADAKAAGEAARHTPARPTTAAPPAP